MSAPIPAWVVTGPLGCGKTTLIAGLLAAKPAHERWTVLLNEFSDAGIDALTVAAAARGPYDVRLVPGGCLCCAGEADFRRTLRELVEGDRPDRIVVEPSGIGHPTGIVEELLAHQAAGGIVLEAVLGLVGASEAGGLDDAERAALARATAEIADLLALAKADLATPAQRAEFEAAAAAMFPAKRAIGLIEDGRLPTVLRAAMDAAPRGAEVFDFRSVTEAGIRPHAHETERRHAAHPPAPPPSAVEVATAAGSGERRDFIHLGRHGASWVFPAAVSFSEARVIAALGADTDGVAGLGRPERIKAVLRVDDDEWVLVQRVGGRVTLAPTAWRRDNRIEVQLGPGSAWDPRAWDALWRGAVRVGPR